MILNYNEFEVKIMDLKRCADTIKTLRKRAGLTQVQLAEGIGVSSKTVSKWETGRGFPDVGIIQELAKVLNTTSDVLLCGNAKTNTKKTKDMKKLSVYHCLICNSLVYKIGNGNLSCCGNLLEAENAKEVDDEHRIEIESIEEDYYIRIDHQMTKNHYIEFVSYVAYNKMEMILLYPEQEPAVRIPKMYGGKFYFYCTKDGLFEFKI